MINTYYYYVLGASWDSTQHAAKGLSKAFLYISIIILFTYKEIHNHSSAVINTIWVATIC